MDMPVNPTNDLLRKLKSLHLHGKFRRELALAEQHWGPYPQWRSQQQLLVGGNIFANLGLRRIAAAMRLWAWRKDRNQPEAIYYRVIVTYSRRGPLAALKLFDRYGDLAQAGATLQAKWLALKASVYGQYRDWKAAHALMERVQQLAPNHPIVVMEQAYLLEQEDRYQEAATVVSPLAEQKFCPAIQFAAHLKTLADDQAGAIAMLQAAMASMESISLCLQLFRLYQQSGQTQEAGDCLQRARQLLPGSKDLSQELAYAEYEVAYENRDFARALAVLESIKAPFYEKVRENLENADWSRSPVKLDVPFVRQHHMTCAPATLTAIARFWQQPADHLNIVEDICYDGTSNQAERQWAIDQGWLVKEFELQPEVAFQLLDRGVPFTLSTVSPGSAHLQAVIGYDPLQGLYLIRDPYYPSVQELLIHEFGLQSASSGPRCLALVPADQGHRFDNIEFPAAQFYDLNFQLQDALKQHQRDNAMRILQQMQQLDKTHRLTLYAERTLARYDNNKLTEYELIDQLLAKYPEDLNLQVEKAYLLGSLGRHKERIEFLKEQTQQADPHPYIVEALANSIRQDNRETEYSKKLLGYVLYRQPTNAFALWMLASSLWDQQQYEKAFEFYRLCTCLEDKHEGYIASYFKAARYLKKQDQAIADLQQRIEAFGKKSFYPHESLYFAYRALSQDQAALDTLLAARQYHEQDNDFIRRLTEVYLYNGMADDARQTLDDGKPYLAETDWLELSARIASFCGDWQQEKSYYEQLLKINPLHYNTIEALAHLLAHHEDEAAAVGFIDTRLAINPTDRGLLFLRLNWMFNYPQAEQEAFARHIVVLHEQDPESHTRLAQILADQAQSIAGSSGSEKAQLERQAKLQEALQQAQTAYQINPYDTDAMLTLGDLYRRDNNFAEAKETYREIIAYSADTDGAFQRLLLCDDSMAAKRESLAFIYDQLMAQTSYGNGILEYLDVARDLIPDEGLLSFLQQAVAIRPDLWQSWAALGMHLGTMDRLTQALDAVSQGVQRFPFIPRLLLERARLFFAAQDFAAAENDLLDALHISPQWIRCVTLLADVYEAQGKLKDAQQLVQNALNHSPKSPNLHGYLADLWYANGDLDAASIHLQDALTLQPDYEWAWDRYDEVCRQKGAPDNSAFQLAKRLQEQYPGSSYLWKVLAEHATNMDHKLEYIDHALRLSPRNEDYNLVKCRILYSDNRLTELRDFIYDTKWGDNPPPSLLAYEAWTDASYQRFDDAIKKMRGVVDIYPYYFDGWRLLSRWLQQVGEYGEAVEHVKKCVRLSPHNPSALTLAAETLLETRKQDIEVDEQQIDQWLRKAVVLDPRNQYIGLTWLDYLLETNNIQGLRAARDFLIFDEDNPYYRVRFLQAALLDQEQGTALRLFKQLLRVADRNEWIFDTSYRELMRANMQPQVFDALRHSLKKSVNPMVGRLWLRYAFDTSGKAATVFDFLNQLQDQPALWLEAMEEVFTPGNYGKITRRIIKRFAGKLQADGRLWSVVVFYYANQRQWGKARQWCQQNWQRESNNAWAVYLYGYGLRLAKAWQQAADVNAYALSLPEDDYIDRILLWHLLDSAITRNETIDMDRIARIRVPELAALESYVYDLMQAMYRVQREGLIDAAEDIFKILEAAKHNHQNILQDGVAHSVKRQVRRFLYRFIKGGVWQQLLWRIRLFNRM